MSYMVVADDEYKAFMRAETKAAKTHEREKKQAAVMRAAAFTGSLMRCPDCGRLVFSPPHATETESYLREERAKRVDDPGGSIANHSQT